MANIILATGEYLDNATITGSSAVGDMSLQNVKAINLFRKYRTENLSAQINIDLGQAQSIDFASIVAHNATATGTVTIKAGSTSAVSDFDSGALDLITGDDLGFSLNNFATQFDAQNYRYWRFDFSDASNPDAYLEMGRIYLSSAFQPNVNAVYGMQESYADASRVKRTVSNAISSVNREPYRLAGFDLDFASKAEMYSKARKIDRLQGVSKDLIFIPDIDDTDYFQERFIYGRISQINPVISEAFSIYRKTYQIEEIK